MGCDEFDGSEDFDVCVGDDENVGEVVGPRNVIKNAVSAGMADGTDGDISIDTELCSSGFSDAVR